MGEKKNPDYSASAVNLTNPIDALNYLKNLHSFKVELDEVETAITMATPMELLTKRAKLQNDIENIMGGIKVVIDNQGSYQDTELGLYAVKQLKRTKLYSATNFESCFPEYAAAVLTKSINVPVLEGLIKGNLLSEEGLRRAHIIEDKESFAYIIK